jgi:hypothetical protein
MIKFNTIQTATADPAVVRPGRKNCSETRRKLVHVQQVEPLLAQVDLLFTLACHGRHQSLGEIEAPARAGARCRNLAGGRRAYRCAFRTARHSFAHRPPTVERP